MAALLLVFPAVELDSESVTLTTYYPAPSGVYTKMVTTKDTILARDSGAVGIGTSTPGDKLHVDGGAVFIGSVTISGSGARRGYLKIDNTNTGCVGNVPGTGIWPPDDDPCAGGYYATFTPGIYIEGYSMQNRGNGARVSYGPTLWTYEVMTRNPSKNPNPPMNDFTWGMVNPDEDVPIVFCCPK